jgi:uncharacterized protein
MTATTDRELSTARPGKPDPGDFLPVMRQDWRDLVFLHWRVDPAAVAARLPAPLVAVDTHDGAAWVGLVPFRVERLRPPGLPPAPGISTFGEVNVRTYVRGPDGQPGLWFASLDADSRLAAEAAKLTYRLPYFAGEVEVRRGGEVAEGGAGGGVAGDAAGSAAVVRWSVRRREGGVASRGACRPGPGTPAPCPPGSLEEFLIERYALFAETSGGLLRARVLHEDYPVAGATLLDLDDGLVAAAGFAIAGEPLVHFSPGVDARISAPEPL